MTGKSRDTSLRVLVATGTDVGICSFISFRTGQYKLHYYESPTNIKFVMLTDTKSPSMRQVLYQIYVNLYIEFGMSFPYPSFQISDESKADRKHSGQEPTLTSRARKRRRRGKRALRISPRTICGRRLINDS